MTKTMTNFNKWSVAQGRSLLDNGEGKSSVIYCQIVFASNWEWTHAKAFPLTPANTYSHKQTHTNCKHIENNKLGMDTALARH